MKNLIEISRLITKKRVRKIEIFDEASLKSRSSMFNKFYEGLINSDFKNDRDAAKVLYNSNPSDDKYRQLKSRFRKRLLNTLFFLDINQADDSDYDQAYYAVNREWALIKVLEHHGAMDTAESMAKSNLTLALKYKFSDIIVNCARLLRNLAAQAEDVKGYAEYDEVLKHYNDILTADTQAEELYHKVLALYSKPIEEVQLHTVELDSWCNSLVSLSEIYESPVVSYYMYLVWVYRFEMLNDYEGMLEVCSRAEKYVEDNPSFHRPDMTALFYLKKMNAYLHLKDYKRGRENAEVNLKSFKEGSSLWFEFLEQYLLLALHTKNYVAALALLNRANSHSRFKKLNSEERDRWLLIELYMQLIGSTVGADHPILSQYNRKNARSNRLLTQDPAQFPRELRMLGLHIQIAKILLLIEREKYTDATDLIVELKTQAERQLKKTEHKRALYFIRLIEQLSKKNFEPLEFDKKPKYLLFLEQTPFRYRGLWSEMEIIPYEHIWEIVLVHLNK